MNQTSMIRIGQPWWWNYRRFLVRLRPKYPKIEVTVSLKTVLLFGFFVFLPSFCFVLFFCITKWKSNIILETLYRHIVLHLNINMVRLCVCTFARHYSTLTYHPCDAKTRWGPWEDMGATVSWRVFYTRSLRLFSQHFDNSFRFSLTSISTNQTDQIITQQPHS